MNNQTNIQSTNVPSAQRDLEHLIRARYPLIYVVSHEESRVMSFLTDTVCRPRRYALCTWSIVSGLQSELGTVKKQDCFVPIKVLDLILNADVADGGVFVLCDFHPYLDDPATLRKLREVVAQLKFKSIVILSPVLKIPREIDKECAVIDYDLPVRAECAAQLDSIECPPNCDNTPRTEQPARDQIVDSLLGLTHTEIDNVLSLSLVRHKTFDVSTILREKKSIIRKSGVLEYYESQSGLTEVGGQDCLKEWLHKRRNAFTQDARAYGLPVPKGLLLIGVPGCGKSLTAKAVSATWRMPCLRLDVGKIFGSLVGDSEKNMRAALKIAEAVSPCVLWLDELEKAFAGVSGSGTNDSGVTARVFGTFITWMQEKTSAVFVIATANDVRGLPPELLRKGRFDEIFYSDLPTAKERQEILTIHMRSKDRDPSVIDLQEVVSATDQFTGSEIEQVVISALHEAYDANPADRTLSTQRLLTACKEIVPLAITMKDRIDTMRDWARTRARPASSSGIPQAQTPDAVKGKGRRRIDSDDTGGNRNTN